MTSISGPELFEAAPNSSLARERRLAGGAPVWMVRMSQPRGDDPDPPMEDVMVQIPMAGDCDLGAGLARRLRDEAAASDGDPGHYARLFRRETGMAPAAWRRERRR